MNDEAEDQKFNAREELEQLHELRVMWEELQASPAWKKLQSQLEEQIKLRTERILLVPLQSADAVFEQEFSKGEVAGMRLVLRLPEQAKEDLQYAQERVKQLMKEQ